LDVLEVCRPCIDGYLLGLLRSRTFGPQEFREDRQGQVWVAPPLARALSETMPLWAGELAPVAEKVAKMFGSNRGSQASRPPTPLTEDNRSAGRSRVRRGERVRRAAKPKPLPAACRVCGLILPRGRKNYCDECLPEFQVEQTAGFVASAHLALTKLRADGKDPAQTPQAKRKMGAANSKQMLAVRAWDREHERPDPEIFKREILPAIQDIPLRNLTTATGLSVQHCGDIRRGLRVPHPRHWEALRSLAPDRSQRLS
jgi:hypothetical protein